MLSEGGPASIVFAATRPQRTRALILTGTFAYFGFAGWDDLDRDPAELRARLVPELGEDYTPSVEQLARFQAWCRTAALGVGQRRGTQGSAAVGAVDTPARNGGAHERQPGDGARDARSGVPDRRAADPADDHRAHPGHPCPRRQSFRCRAAGTSPTTSPVRGCSRSRAVDHAPWFTDPDRS